MKTVLSHANLIDRVEPNVRPDSAVLIEKVTLFWTELITVAHVGDLGLFAWDAIIEVARHDVVEAEELDVRVDPKRKRERRPARSAGGGGGSGHRRGDRSGAASCQGS
jgi:hypothetical protein